MILNHTIGERFHVAVRGSVSCKPPQFNLMSSTSSRFSCKLTVSRRYLWRPSHLVRVGTGFIGTGAVLIARKYKRSKNHNTYDRKRTHETWHRFILPSRSNSSQNPTLHLCAIISPHTFIISILLGH